MYDFGVEKNLEIYGQETPKLYDLTKVKDFPIALLGGTTDKMASINDFRWLREELANR